jgi:hypothetical protein
MLPTTNYNHRRDFALLLERLLQRGTVGRQHRVSAKAFSAATAIQRRRRPALPAVNHVLDGSLNRSEIAPNEPSQTQRIIIASHPRFTTTISIDGTATDRHAGSASRSVGNPNAPRSSTSQRLNHGRCDVQQQRPQSRYSQWRLSTSSTVTATIVTGGHRRRETAQ